MQINYTKKFQKAFLKLDNKHRAKVLNIIQIFQENPLSQILRNHPLKGSMLGQSAISVTGDLRIIFEEHQEYTLVLMLDLGTHNQVY